MGGWIKQNPWAFLLGILTVGYACLAMIGLLKQLYKGVIQLYKTTSEKWIKHHTALREESLFNHFPSTIGKHDYFEDSPWNGSLMDIVSMVKIRYITQFWDAYILFWMHLGYMRLVPELKAVQLSQTPPPFSNELEQELWMMMVDASRGDLLLDPNEIPRYCFVKSTEVYNLQFRAKKRSEQVMDQAGMTKTVTRHFLWKPFSALITTPQGQQMVNRCAGLKNYLKDVSLIKNRKAVEVTLWDQYMVWAAFFGIALEARKDTGTVLNIQALLDNLS